MTLIKFKHIKYKLITTYLLLIISTLIIVLSITYFSSIEIIKNQSITLNNKLVEMGANNLDSYIGEIDKIYQSLYINTNFKRIISSQTFIDEYDFISTFTSLKNIMHSYINSRKDIFSIVYLDNNYLIYIGQSEAGYEKAADIDKTQEGIRDESEFLKNKYTDLVIFPTHTNVSANLKITNSKEKVFTVARNIVNVEREYGKVGSLYINVDLSILSKIAADIKPYNSSFTYILSDDGTIVFDSSGVHTAQMISLDILKNFRSKAGYSQLDISGNKYMTVYTTSDKTGWKIINFIPVEQYSANMSFVTKIVLIICLIAITFAIFITIIISSRISNPIEKLSQIMNKIDLGNMSLRADESRHDEIGMLSKSFNSLIRKFQSSIKKEYEANIRQKDSEMKALQAQINPHFLYNVLQSISSIAILHDIDEVNVMAKSLGKMLRYSIKTNENVVSVEEEIEHVINYLSIQKIRFGDKSLDFIINIPDHIKKYSILKLSLQPIIENAIIHGFDGKNEKGIICISCYEEGEYISIEVSDNGRGLNDKKLKKITRELNSADNAYYSDISPSIGLKNVLLRLRIFYGGEVSMNILSEIDVGTCVRIKFPIRNARR